MNQAKPSQAGLISNLPFPSKTIHNPTGLSCTTESIQ